MRVRHSNGVDFTGSCSLSMDDKALWGYSLKHSNSLNG